MEARHALLIGIPRCDNDAAFPPIPDDVVRSDITRMARALSQSGYVITVLGVAPADDVQNVRYVTEPASRSRCLDEIADACNGVPEGGTLLIYFSGHGVRIGGADFLVPRDFSRLGPDGRMPTGRLVPVDFSEEAALCQARVMLCFIDACRNPPVADQAESGQPTTQLPKGSFVLVRGCAPDEICEWQEGYGSVFTRALAHALQRNQSPRTLGQVLQATRDRLREQDSAQRPHTMFAGPVAESEVLSTVICEGVRLLDDWRTAVINSRLWTLADDSGPVEALRITVRDLVSGYGKQVGQMRDHLAETESLIDTWTDDGYPGRVLDALYQLLAPPDSPPAALHPTEVAALIAAPFLREAVLALGLYNVTEVQPRDFTRHFGTGFRSDLENVFASHEQLTRRASGLAESKPADRDTLVMWMVHRWILEREDLWEGQTAQALAIDLARAVLTAAGLPASEARSRELGHVSLPMIRCLTTALGPENRGSDVRLETVRRRPLGYLLSVAGVLGADPRRMSGVLADHIGTYDTLDLRQLHETLGADMTWRRDGDEFVVDAVCEHPAMHVALADLSEEADYACMHARKASLDMPGHEGDLLTGIPARCGEDLRPEGTAYGKPLMRFHLAGDRIRDLLMGTQLYGDDASVAIREVYQNALDACRYRHMRLRYSQRTEEPRGWNGKIVLRQGVDPDDGRHYVECEDNGVGMTEAVLRHVFTAAGTRFVHTELFRREEARWRQVNSAYRLYPNSQFGIGVFSYFMLADEVSVWTAATDESGLGVNSRLHIHIPGPGGLFRLRRDEPMPEGILGGGTIIRLYLSAPLRDFTENILAYYLVVSDYKIEAWRDGTLMREWTPGVPEYPDSTAPPQAGADRVWWISGAGRLLSDGLAVGRLLSNGFAIRRQNALLLQHGEVVASTVRATGEADNFGQLVDLTGPHQPRLSVDRTSILDWDQDWVRNQVRNSIPSLVGWPGFTWTWLWSLMQSDLTLAQAIYEQHSEQVIPIDSERNSPVAQIGEIGFYPDDSYIFRKSTSNNRVEWSILLPWRRSLWRHLAGKNQRGALGLVGSQELIEPQDTAGFPVPTPSDVRALSWVRAILTSTPGHYRAGRRPSAERLKFAPLDLLYHLRRFVMAGFNLSLLQDFDDDCSLEMTASIVALENTYADAPVPVQLLMVAVHMERPVREIAELFRVYAENRGFPLPEPDCGSGFVPTETDLRMVSADLDGVAPWRTHLSESLVREAWPELNEPNDSGEKIHERITAYRQAGFIVVPMRPVERPSADDPVAVAIYKAARNLTGPPEPSQLSDLAVSHEMSERDVYHLIVKTAKSLGMTIPENEIDNLPENVPTEADSRIIERILSQGGKGARSLAWIIRDRREYMADTPADQAAALYLRNRYLLDIPDKITTAHAMLLASQLGTSVDHAISVVRELFAHHLDLTGLPGTSGSLASLRPSDEEADALLDIDDERTAWRSPPADAIADLGLDSARTIGEILETLSAYVPLGAVIPEIDMDLARYQPDIYDCRVLGIPKPGETVTAMQLIRIAGRYGWTVRHTFDRLNRFQALGIRLESTRENCPEAIVHWADVIVLSEHYDGTDPSLCGPVSPERIAEAAEIVRETATETRARLLRYADLFRLEVQELT